jgi:hypothetical protein
LGRGRPRHDRHPHLDDAAHRSRRHWRRRDAIRPRRLDERPHGRLDRLPAGRQHPAPRADWQSGSRGPRCRRLSLRAPPASAARSAFELRERGEQVRHRLARRRRRVDGAVGQLRGHAVSWNRIFRHKRENDHDRADVGTHLIPPSSPI